LKRIILILFLVLAASPASADPKRKITYVDSVHHWSAELAGKVRTQGADIETYLLHLVRREGGAKILEYAYNERRTYDYVELHVLVPDDYRLFWTDTTTVIITLDDGTQLESQGTYFTESLRMYEIWTPKECSDGRVEIKSPFIAQRGGSYLVFVKFRKGPEGRIASMRIEGAAVKPRSRE
jgi:hypothetical protein